MQLVRLPELSKILGVSKDTIRRWEIKKDGFPQSFFLGSTTYSGKTWDLADINAWLEAKKNKPESGEQSP